MGFIYRRRNVIKMTVDHSTVPSHMIIEKTEHLSEDLDNTSAEVDRVITEFNMLEEFVAAHVDKHKQITIGLDEEIGNLKKNRYRDMVPFDDNIVTLSKPSGEPPTTYINASEVKSLMIFPGAYTVSVFRLSSRVLTRGLLQSKLQKSTCLLDFGS